MPGKIPQDLYIDINTIEQDIDDCIMQFFKRFNIDIYDPKECRASVTHNMLNLCFKQCFRQLFKPDRTLCNNQNSRIDYENIELLQTIADSFVKWCLWFNKSMGIMSFSMLTGIRWETLAQWRDHPETNYKRSQLVKYIQEYHKAEQIALLNDTPVGALAVANNDTETGLRWAANNAQQITNNTVYLLPSERTDRLKLDKLPE